MINFIICDNYVSAKHIKTVVDSYMMNYDIEVKYHLFINNNDMFKEEVQKINGLKVYILNDDKEEGIKKSKFIRKELDDWNTPIILTTIHNESNNKVIGNGLFLFDYLSKKNFFERKLKEDLNHIMKYYDNRNKCLTYEYNKIIKKIDFKDIDMVIKEKDSKKCIIKTNFGDYYILESISSMTKKLDERFIKISRSCIVNIEKIIEYDINNNKLTFENGVVSFETSRDYKKKVTKHLFNYNKMLTN